MFSSDWGCGRLCPTDWWHVDVVLHPCLGSARERCWRAAACLAKGPGTSGNSHVLWHRHPATRVLVLAQHFSVLAQKNIIELCYWFRVSGSCAIHQTRNPPGREQGIRRGLRRVSRRLGGLAGSHGAAENPRVNR